LVFFLFFLPADRPNPINILLYISAICSIFRCLQSFTLDSHAELSHLHADLNSCTVSLMMNKLHIFCTLWFVSHLFLDVNHAVLMRGSSGLQPNACPHPLNHCMYINAEICSYAESSELVTHRMSSFKDWIKHYQYLQIGPYWRWFWGFTIRAKHTRNSTSHRPLKEQLQNNENVVISSWTRETSCNSFKFSELSKCFSILYVLKAAVLLFDGQCVCVCVCVCVLFRMFLF